MCNLSEIQAREVLGKMSKKQLKYLLGTTSYFLKVSNGANKKQVFEIRFSGKKRNIDSILSHITDNQFQSCDNMKNDSFFKKALYVLTDLHVFDRQKKKHFYLLNDRESLNKLYAITKEIIHEDVFGYKKRGLEKRYRAPLVKKKSIQKREVIGKIIEVFLHDFVEKNHPDPTDTLWIPLTYSNQPEIRQSFTNKYIYNPVIAACQKAGVASSRVSNARHWFEPVFRKLEQNKVLVGKIETYFRPEYGINNIPVKVYYRGEKYYDYFSKFDKETMKKMNNLLVNENNHNKNLEVENATGNGRNEVTPSPAFIKTRRQIIREVLETMLAKLKK